MEIKPDNNENNNNKIIEIVVSPSSIKNIILDKQKSNRVITTTKKWDLKKEDFKIENQLAILTEIQNPNIHETKMEKKRKLFMSEITQKLNSYRHQDIQKKLYSEKQFISFQDTVSLLIQSQLICFYCKKNVHVIYNSVRDATQWTLERIDNQYGHNTDNVEIACLSCNIKRRTMYHERFLFTKQLGVITKLD